MTNTNLIVSLNEQIRQQELILAQTNPITTPDVYTAVSYKIKSLKTTRDNAEQNGTGMEQTITTTSSKPVVLYGVTKLDVSWEHSIGNKQGLRANFLQPWFNKPVDITIEGESYMGSWGGETVSQAVNDAYSSSTKSNVFDKLSELKSSISKTVNSAQQDVQQFIKNVTTAVQAKSYQTTGPFIDQTIPGIQSLISFFPYGPNSSINPKASNITFQLLVENEPTGNPNDPYAVFEGFIKNFRYSESIENPYIHNYTISFVGEPKQKAKIGNQEINAQLELSKMGVTTAISSSGKAITLFTLG
jgi:hypothetical protein